MILRMPLSYVNTWRISARLHTPFWRWYRAKHVIVGLTLEHLLWFQCGCVLPLPRSKWYDRGDRRSWKEHFDGSWGQDRSNTLCLRYCRLSDIDITTHLRHMAVTLRDGDREPLHPTSEAICLSRKSDYSCLSSIFRRVHERTAEILYLVLKR